MDTTFDDKWAKEDTCRSGQKLLKKYQGMGKDTAKVPLMA